MSIIKTATVLGASGNIGQLLVQHLVAEGYLVKAIGRTTPKFNHSNITNIAVNPNDGLAIEEAMRGSAVTFMLIGIEYKTNVWEKEWPPLVARILQATENTDSKLIFFDNVYPYGSVTGPMTEKTPMQASSRKGVVRQKLDEMILEMMSQGRIRAVIARAADFYGPGVTTAIIGDRFFKLLHEKQQLEWLGNPDKVHSFTYLPDLPAALQALAESDFTGVIHLPTAKPPLNGHQVLQIFENITGSSLKLTPMRESAVFFLRLFVPILREIKEMFYQYEQDYFFDSSLFEQMFPEIQPTPYNVGLATTATSYRIEAKM